MITDREESVEYLRLHAPKSEEVHQEIIPAGWCLIWHGPYSFKKMPTPTPLQITAVHDLKPGDSAKRLAYCKWFLDFLDHEGEDILKITFFTDKAYFHLSWYINSQNSHVWCAHNPHVFHESPLHDEKIGIWVGMSCRRIVGPIFFSETLNSQWYCDNIVYPFIVQLKEDETDKAFFQ
jgi:hypothetical protein